MRVQRDRVDADRGALVQDAGQTRHRPQPASTGQDQDDAPGRPCVSARLSTGHRGAPVELRRAASPSGRRPDRDGRAGPIRAAGPYRRPARGRAAAARPRPSRPAARAVGRQHDQLDVPRAVPGGDLRDERAGQPVHLGPRHRPARGRRRRPAALRAARRTGWVARPFRLARRCRRRRTSDETVSEPEPQEQEVAVLRPPLPEAGQRHTRRLGQQGQIRRGGMPVLGLPGHRVREIRCRLGRFAFPLQSASTVRCGGHPGGR